MSQALHQIMRKYHTVIGVLVAFHLLILAPTGLILLFKAEVQHTDPSNNTLSNPQAFIEKYNQAYQFLLSHYQNDKLLDMYPDENNSQIIQARLGINGVNKVRGARIVNVDYQSGQEVQATALTYSAGYDWLLSLHHQLFLGTSGQLYVGVIGVAFLLMNVTGLFLFFKNRQRRFSQRKRSTQYAIWHQYLGLICLGWGLLVSLTGALLAFNPIFTQQFQKNTLQPLAQKYQTQKALPQTRPQSEVTLGTILTTAYQAKPQGVIDYIIFPGMERGIQDHYLVSMHGSGLINRFMSDYLVINARSAELKEMIHLPLSMQLVLMATPLHTAKFGGIFVKMVWSLFAITTLIFMSMGIKMLYMRKRLSYVKNKQSLPSLC